MNAPDAQQSKYANNNPTIVPSAIERPKALKIAPLIFVERRRWRPRQRTVAMMLVVAMVWSLGRERVSGARRRVAEK
ncbi:hypothetical protein ACFPN2_19940 [Steroidobacter flavus]|uniref:Uncharacterized protein n=1 Tax=Steroidobacter flavus TaxID=1842136 RepID=A0ABV8SV16_9GAMM